MLSDHKLYTKFFRHTDTRSYMSQLFMIQLSQFMEKTILKHVPEYYIYRFLLNFLTILN